MTVKDLIEKLQQVAPTYEPQIEDDGLMFPVTEIVVNHETRQVTIW